MKYIGIFFSILILGSVALALFKPRIAGASAASEYISHGDAVTFGDYLPDEPGHVVLFQFTADWCGPCRMIEPNVAELVEYYGFVERKKIDIVSWDSAAAQQMNDFFDASYIPFFALYNDKGEPLAIGNYQHIERTIHRLSQAK